jgi:hypothetical protein
MLSNSFLRILFIGSLMGFLFACGGGKKEDNKVAQAVADCVFPNTNTPAPGWICDEPIPGLELQAVGVAEYSAAGLSYMKDLAAADARGKIVEQFKVRVDKMVKSYVGTTGVGDSETVDRAAESVLKTVSSETLVGSKIYKSRTGPDKRLYVVVGVDPKNFEKAAEQSARTSMNNENALWQQFKAKQGFDEMAKEIAKQKVQ